MIRRRIGGGGQASVFEAICGEASDVVAIKPIFTRRTKKAGRFKREVEQHVRLSAERAPNIIPVIDHQIAVRSDGSVEAYIVMPLAHASLEDVSTTFLGRFELSLDTFLGIVRGVEAAHRAGVIHRDLKPANVLFLGRSLREPLVSDFGICLVKEARREERLTDVGETVGARFYMAPEQERGGVVDVTEAADIYALGKLLHHMLTGRTLYREELQHAFSADELMTDGRLDIVRREVLERTVVTEAGRRIQSASELREVIEGLIARFRPSSPAPMVIRDAPATDAPLEWSACDIGKIHETAVREIVNGGASIVALRFDKARHRFDEAWNVVRKHVRPCPESLLADVAALVRSQEEITFTLPAVARFDASAIFSGIPGYLEYLVNSTEGVAGERQVMSVPHIAAGFQYMTAAVAALTQNAWKMLSLLLNLKLEWHCQSPRPFYSYAFALSYFFRPEALERKATAAHDLYRSMMNASNIGRFCGLMDDDLTTPYVQAQFLMSIKAAQLNEEEGDDDVEPFAYFGRFYGERLQPLLTRMERDATFASGVTAAFGETPDEWFARLSERLLFVRTNFWDPAVYDWASLETWPE